MLAECCDVMVAGRSPPPLYAAATHNAQPEFSMLYQNLRLVMTHKQQSPLAVRRFNARPGSAAGSSGSPPTDRQAAKPRRPCLVVRTDSDGSIGSTSSSSSSSSSSDENEPSSPTRNKKKVVFADDRGLSLTQVRLMNEPSNQPPKLMTVSPFLNQQSAAAAAAGCKPSEPLQQPPYWQLRFPQPASSYLDFRKRLDMGNVSLENVIVKSPEHRIVGTVKVRNLSYDKEVFVRSTDDHWTTHRDTLCTYVQNYAMANVGGSCGKGNGSGPLAPGAAAAVGPAGPSQNVTAIYDTFAFRLTLPNSASSLEFAVCYKSPHFECWDNNDGLNYCLSKSGGQSAAVAQQSSSCGGMLSSSAPNAGPADFEHAAAPKPVHYFGAQSRQHSWNTWRDQKNETYAYW